MDFHGQAKKLSADDVTIIAGYLGWEVAMVRAVLAVEARNRGFVAGRPLILNEPHHLYHQLGGALRRAAVNAGLAYKKWGQKPYLKTQNARYNWLAKAMQIDEAAALKSCSWGLGQVMGFNHKVSGFKTVHEFVEAMKYSEGAQLYAMARYIVGNRLQRHLAGKKRNFAGFAKGYNGPGYKKNAYDTRMASEYDARPAAEKFVPPPATEEQLAALLGKLPSKHHVEKPADVAADAAGAAVPAIPVALAAAQSDLHWGWIVAGVAVVAIIGAIIVRKIRKG